MGKITSLFFLLLFFITTSSTQTILKNKSPYIWLSADKNINNIGNKVTSWTDQSNNFVFEQSNSTYQPTLNIDTDLNNKPYIKFNNSQLLSLDNFSFTNATIIILAKQYAGESNYGRLIDHNFQNGFWIGRENNNNKIGGGFIEPNVPHGNFTTVTNEDPFIISLSRNVDTTFYWLNDEEFSSHFRITYLSSTSSNKISIGSAISNNFYGHKDIYEIIIYNEKLSQSDLDSVSNYIKYKYFPKPNLGSDINLDETTNCPINLTFNTTNFPGPYLWSTGETSASINTNKPGTYWVKAKNNFGLWISDTININSEYSFKNDTTICMGDSLKWNTNLGIGYNFLWSDGKTTSSNDFHNTDTHWVEISNNFGCSYRDTVILKIDSFQINGISLGPDKTICLGEKLILNQGEENCISFLWSTGSTGNFTDIITPGEYSIITSDSIGCIAKDTINITISGAAPIIDLSINNHCLNDFTQFSDLSSTSSGVINDWKWYFGNGDSASVSNPIYQYSDTGSYNVKLIIGTDEGCSNFLDTVFSIFPIPSTDFTSSIFCDNQLGKLISTSHISTGSIIENRWSYSYVSDTIGDTIQYIFTTSGVKNIILTSTSDKGCISQTSNSITVNDKPISDFTVIPKCVGDPISFFPNVNTSLSGPVTLEWEIDGSIDNSQSSTNYIFNSPGNKEINLFVERVDGLCKDTISKSIEILSYPKVLFNTDTICTGQNQTLIDRSYATNSSILHRKWTIPSKPISYDSAAMFTFSNTGVIPINLEVANEYWCYSDTTINAEIKQSPTASFHIGNEIGEAPLTVEFSNSSINADNYTWDFDLIHNSTLTNPNHTYVSEGIYYPTLEAISNNGCRDFYTTMITVSKPQLDLEIEMLNVNTNSSNHTESAIRFKNNGNVTIREIYFTTKIGKGNIATEKWEGHLSPGATEFLTLNTMLNFNNQYNENYLCITGTAINQFNDIDLTNNTICSTLTEEEQLYQIFPNPSKEELNIQFSLERNSIYNIQIINLHGKIIIEKQNEVVLGNNKYNNINIDIRNLASGQYYIKLNSESSTFVQKFIKID